MTALQSQFKQELASLQDNTTWRATCANSIYNLFSANNSSVTDKVLNGIVDGDGNQINHSTGSPYSLGGITYRLCDEYCNYSKIQTVFNLETFSAGATNYLLPWLALTAQLPFEAGENEIAANIMSFCYALGSPMLITYSLMITILNQHWIRNKFRLLEASNHPLHSKSKNIRIFLQECQQLPLRLSQKDGHLASLIILTENKQWWKNLRASIMMTRRGVTLSLVAQILVAILSWTLTIVAAFQSSLGNPTQALELASGSLWIWLVPVVCGWIAVGTQKDSGTINRALKRDSPIIVEGANMGDQNSLHVTESHRHTRDYSFEDRPVTSNQAGGLCTEQTRNLTTLSPTTTLRQPDDDHCSGGLKIVNEQKAFHVAKRNVLTSSLLESPIQHGSPNPERNQVPDCLGFSIEGDEMQEGPVFNFARVFTWWNMTESLYNVLETTMRNIEDKRDLNLRKAPEKFEIDDLKGDTLLMLRYCGLASVGEGLNGQRIIEAKEIDEYPSWDTLDSDFYKRIIMAIIMAAFVQWGTTSAAVIIALLTKVKGLGCRSGGYILYGVNGTISFTLIFASTLFSHTAMLHHQAIERRRRASADENDARDKTATETTFLTFFRVCAVVTRLLGRALVVLNTLWILVSSMFELIGFYGNCWCEGVYVSKGSNGWVLLFDQSNELAKSALGPWSGSVFVSVFVSVTSFVIFWLCCRGNHT